jgi:predicted Zn-dependent peptidase
MKNWNQQDLERYFKHTMHQITVVVVSGAIKTEEVKRLAQKYLRTNSSSTSTTESPYCGTSTNWRTKNNSSKRSSYLIL